MINILSYIQYIAWVGITAGALIAAINLKRNTQQSRANFLLTLIPMWEKLSPSRAKMQELKLEILNEISKRNVLKEEDKLNLLRDLYEKKLRQIESNSGKDLHLIYEYLNYFETIGLMVRKRYIYFDDVYLLYKGPIIDMELAFNTIILEWQNKFHESEGMYENVLYLIEKVQEYEKKAPPRSCMP